jgi:hypothetical protein
MLADSLLLLERLRRRGLVICKTTIGEQLTKSCKKRPQTLSRTFENGDAICAGNQYHNHIVRLHVKIIPKFLQCFSIARMISYMFDSSISSRVLPLVMVQVFSLR